MSGTLDLLNAARLAFYDNSPTALIVQTVVQSIPNNTDTAIILDTVENDNWGGWASGSPTRYTIQVPGVYLIGGQVVFAGNATNRRLGFIRVNGTTNIVGGGGDFNNNGSFACSAPAVPVPWFFNAGDYVELMGNQNSGGALNTNANTGSVTPSLSVVWLHN